MRPIDTVAAPEPSAETEDRRADDLASELARVAPRPWWNRGTVALAAAALLLGGFIGGLQVQKQWGTSGATAGRGGFGTGQGRGSGTGQNRGFGNGPEGPAAGQFGGGAPAGGAPAGGTGTAAAPVTTGTVKLVDGSTIYVQTAGGDVLTVQTDAHTSISTATKSTVKNIKAGQSVTVQGPAGADGTVAATAVTAGPR
ncbi:hypothetical protein [Krasilnikovia sp. MM14-A1259]|uniref:hypothetical protein n=1 Tax=Krasilnikovia sp. MM14-A1259 TaxID=3373539 RepID=UPI00382C6F2B